MDPENNGTGWTPQQKLQHPEGSRKAPILFGNHSWIKEFPWFLRDKDKGLRVIRCYPLN